VQHGEPHAEGGAERERHALALRAFLALPVTSPALEAGTRLLDELRASLPEVRWVRPEGLHLTLHFWPDLREDRVTRLLDAASAPLRNAAPFDMALGGLGAFPRDGDERVLWMGMRQGEAQAVALQDDVEQALDAAGFPGEQRAFHPHVTLGRPRQRLDGDARRRWRAFAEAALPPCAVRDVVLYRSHPGPGGSRYEVLQRLPLSVSASA
jgi:2'-5' RNA ligase